MKSSWKMAEATKEVLMCRKLKKKSVMKTSDKTSKAINGYANSGNIVRYVWPYAALLIICLVLVVFF